jgi:hypothetical protein
MTFADLLAGESVFLDANALVYHFAAHPAFGAACTRLLQRIENQELLGFSSTPVLSEEYGWTGDFPPVAVELIK